MLFKVNIWNVNIWFEIINGKIEDENEGLINCVIKGQYELGRTKNDLLKDAKDIINLIDHQIIEFNNSQATRESVKKYKANVGLSLAILTLTKFIALSQLKQT